MSADASTTIPGEPAPLGRSRWEQPATPHFGLLVVGACGSSSRSVGTRSCVEGEPPEAERQRRNLAAAATVLAELAGEHDLVVTHGNGPQVGLLALQSEAIAGVRPYPLDVLGAESEGMIGYVLEQELRNRLPGRDCATLLTQVIVDRDDPGFATSDEADRAVLRQRGCGAPRTGARVAVQCRWRVSASRRRVATATGVGRAQHHRAPRRRRCHRRVCGRRWYPGGPRRRTGAARNRGGGRQGSVRGAARSATCTPMRCCC